MIIVTSDPVFCAHGENTSYPNNHDGVRFGTLIFLQSIIWYHMIWWHMIGGGVVWCAWYAYLFIFWCAWYAKILMYLSFWSNMIGGGMVWSAWYAGRVEGLPAEALQPLPRSLNLHNIFILSKYHFSFTYHFNLIALRFTQFSQYLYWYSSS